MNCLRCAKPSLVPAHLYEAVFFLHGRRKARLLSVPTFQAKAHVCLDCGHVEFLADLAEVRRQMERFDIPAPG